MTVSGEPTARDSYERMAPFYDAFTAHHDYGGWTRSLEGIAREHGLCGRALLDVGCGTGKSFLPMLERGYDVVACDVAPAMVAQARLKAPAARVHVCDVRELPRLGSFELVWCLDDCLNHMLDSDALTRALAGIARNLAEDGIALFDLNTLRTFRSFFASTSVIETDRHVLVWRGEVGASFSVADIASARLTCFVRGGADRWSRVELTHVQRHHCEAEVRDAIATAGLECLGVYGHGLDGHPHADADELLDTKAVYVARRALKAERR